MRNAWRTQRGNELVGLRPGSDKMTISTNNYQVIKIEEESKLIACLNCELKWIRTKETKCENKC